MTAEHNPFLEHNLWLPDQPITAHCPLDCLYFPLSGGAYNALARGLPQLLGCPATVGDVADLHRQRRLGEVRYLGPRRISEIELLLVVHGFSVACDSPPARDNDTADPR